MGSIIGGRFISVDESYFVYIKGEKIWILGAKNNETLKFRLDIYKRRTEDDWKRFIFNHIRESNTIVTDGWGSYSFLNRNDINYLNEVHVHTLREIFVLALIIQALLKEFGNLETIFKIRYNVIGDENFILYLQDHEFRFNIKSFD